MGEIGAPYLHRMCPVSLPFFFLFCQHFKSPIWGHRRQPINLKQLLRMYTSGLRPQFSSYFFSICQDDITSSFPTRTALPRRGRIRKKCKRNQGTRHFLFRCQNEISLTMFIDFFSFSPSIWRT